MTPTKELINAFQAFGNRHSIWKVFEDYLALGAISVSNAVDKREWVQRENVYKGIIDLYTREEQARLAEMLAMLTGALQTALETSGPTDILGEVFHALGLHSKYRGQYFTPPHVANMMGRFTFCEHMEALEKRGYFTAYEPCIGSGTLILGLANAMYQESCNYCTQLCVTGCDIDLKCVHMAYLQLSFYGIPAVVIHGNSLTQETWSHWYTPAYILGGWRRREQESLRYQERSSA